MKKIILIILAFVMLLFPSCNNYSEYSSYHLQSSEYLESNFAQSTNVIKFYDSTLRLKYFETQDSPIDMLKYTEEVAKENSRPLTQYYLEISNVDNIEYYAILFDYKNNTLINTNENIPNWLIPRIAERIDYYREPEKILEKAGIKANVKDVILFAQPNGPIAKEIGIFFECGKTDYVYIMEEHWELVDGKATNYTYPEYVIPHDIYLETIRIFKPWTLYGGVRIDEWQQRYNENFKVEEYKISLVEE